LCKKVGYLFVYSGFCDLCAKVNHSNVVSYKGQFYTRLPISSAMQFYMDRLLLSEFYQDILNLHIDVISNSNVMNCIIKLEVR
jgi:hypothetical protein